MEIAPDVARTLRQALENLQRAGVTHLGRQTRKESRPVAPHVDTPAQSKLESSIPVSPRTSVPDHVEGKVPSSGAKIPAEQKLAQLQVIQAEIAGCMRCCVNWPRRVRKPSLASAIPTPGCSLSAKRRCRRRPTGRTFRGSGGATPYRHYHQGYEASSRRRVYSQRPQMPSAE